MPTSSEASPFTVEQDQISNLKNCIFNGQTFNGKYIPFKYKMYNKNALISIFLAYTLFWLLVRS